MLNHPQMITSEFQDWLFINFNPQNKIWHAKKLRDNKKANFQRVYLWNTTVI